MIKTLLLFITLSWCSYQQLLLYNQELIQKEIVKDLIVIRSELDMYTKTDLVK